jgi:hypothetical protein
MFPSVWSNTQRTDLGCTAVPSCTKIGFFSYQYRISFWVPLAKKSFWSM